jgi:hypothetical protein
MLRLSKTQFSRAIEGSDVPTDKNSIERSDAPTDEQAPLSAQNRPRRTSKVLLTALVVALGVGAGWVGGKVLNGRMSHSTAAPSNVSGDNSAPNAQPQPESRTGKPAATPDNAATTSQPAPEVEQPGVVSDSRPKEAEPKEAEPKEAPPKVPRVEKDEEVDKPATEDPSKEIGREALKKMSKEIKKTKRASGNKNEDQDRQ